MNHEEVAQLAPKLLTIIADRDHVGRLEDMLREKHIHLHYMFNGMGTASSEVLRSLGLSGSEKTVCLCMVPGVAARSLMASVADRLSLAKPGRGITFIIPVSGAGAAVSRIFSEEANEIRARMRERWENYMEMEEKTEQPNGEAGWALVIAVINQGFSEVLMHEARAVGARGGTIVHARRAGLEDVVKFFGVTLHAEKEIVAILAPRGQKRELMQAITKKCGLNTEAHGIVISLPVESCAGLGE